MINVKKIDMCRTIVTALWNMPAMVTEQNRVQWKEVQRMMRQPKERLQDQYNTAYKILYSRR